MIRICLGFCFTLVLRWQDEVDEFMRLLLGRAGRQACGGHIILAVFSQWLCLFSCSTVTPSPFVFLLAFPLPAVS